MRHWLAGWLYWLSEKLDHRHCVACSCDDGMCCIDTPEQFHGCYSCSDRASVKGAIA